jgi:D-alanyl-lipoteichoic acid acyltransferase DltB (MBOAT superfamily)
MIHLITKHGQWLVALLAVTIWGVVSEVTPPMKMVLIAILVFLVVKWQALTSRKASETRLTVGSIFAWYALVPTLDATGFFDAKLEEARRPRPGQWGFAVLKTLTGAVLFCLVAPLVFGSSDLIAGWIALTGIVLSLHFGFLEIIVLCWRSAGRDVRPLMLNPISATSLSDFWGRRWNTAFRDFAHEQIFRPLCRRWNPRLATLASFVFSGAIHELAISVPAGAGYGLPFVYFALQFVGISLERAAVERGLAVRSGICGWLYAATFLILPAGLLFHSSFVRSVIVPLIPCGNWIH